MIDELKKLRDETKATMPEGLSSADRVTRFVGLAQEPARTPEQIAILDTIIKMFEGDSAEADVLEAQGMIERHTRNGSADLAAACKSGALALRALPKVMAEVERLREALKRMNTFAEYARYELEDKHSPMEQFPCKECCDRELNKARAALNEGAKNG